MQRFHQPGNFRSFPSKQRGVALMVMLVIMVVGAATFLVSSLASSAIKIERDKTTANALAQAKEALIGYAIRDTNHPGSLPCPDVNDDGKLTIATPPPYPDFNGGSCTSLIGRLPWITLGLPELRDGAGEHLWYAVSKPFAAVGNPSINSETQGTLSISGTNPSSQVIAIVFAPGQVLNGTSRSASVTATCSSLKDSPTVAQSWCATNYLEGSNATLNYSSSLNLNYQSADTSSTFNDRMIFITHKDLMPLVEKRIAREVKGCLDGYAAAPANAGTYPWAAPVNDTTYTGTTDTLFGRLPKSNTYSPTVQQLLDGLAALQAALNNYSAKPSSTTAITALQTAGTTLKTYALAQTPTTAAPLDQASLNQAANAGDYALSPHTPSPGATPDTQFVTSLQSQINQAYTFFASPQHGNVTPGWALSSCTIFSSSNSYWDDWKNLVFYQIADGYKPGVSSPSCGASPNTCLSIAGSGNTVAGSGTYRAAVIVAGRKLGSQMRDNPAANPPDDYLANTTSENSSDPSFVTNAHNNTALTTTFITYKLSDPNYPMVNDLVLCLDGRNNCK